MNGWRGKSKGLPVVPGLRRDLWINLKVFLGVRQKTSGEDLVGDTEDRGR